MKNGEIYTFGFPNGKPPDILRKEKENWEFEQFLRKILTSHQMRIRERMRSIESAIRTVVNEIMDACESPSSN